MSDRVKVAGVAGVHAECQGCGWTDELRGALGRAALHHDRTGHRVEVATTTVVIYGDRGAALEAAGQGALDV